MNKKIIASVLTSALTLSLCAGCAPAPTTSTSALASSQSTGASTASDAPITLRFSWWGGDERLAATLAVIDQFEALYPNISIEPEYGSSDGYSDKLATQLASGTEPDIMQIDPSLMPALVTPGTDYFIDYLEAGFDFSGFDENYYTQRMNGHYNNKQLGVPTGMSGPAVLVNQTLADKIGIDFTTDYTWDDLFAWGKKVQEYDSSMYLLCVNKEILANILANNYAKQLTGETILNEETKSVNITEAQFTEVYTFIKKLFDEKIIAPASYSSSYSGDNLQSDPNWIAGKYVASITHMSLIEILAAANTKDEYTVGNMAVSKDALIDGWNANCPQLITISNRSKNKEAALLFVDYFFNNETALDTLKCTRAVPATEKALKICVENGSLSPLLASAAEVAGKYKGLVDDQLFSSQECRQIVIDAVESVGFGASTPAQAAKETITLLENYVASKQ